MTMATTLFSRADDAERCPIPMRSWFPDSLSDSETPLSLVVEWLVGEVVDAMNCAASTTEDDARKIYLPMTGGHVSECVLSLLQFLETIATRMRGIGKVDYQCTVPTPYVMETIATRHASRLPDPRDVERANGGFMTRERPVYALGPASQSRTVGARSAMDFAPRPASAKVKDDECADAMEISILHFVATLLDREEEEEEVAMDVARGICDLTWTWLSTLVRHYAFAQARISDADDMLTSAAVPSDTRTALEIAVSVFCQPHSPLLVSECVRGCFVRAMSVAASECDCEDGREGRRHRRRAGVGSWNANLVGYPFATWSMLSRLPECSIRAYEDLVSRARGSDGRRSVPRTLATMCSFARAPIARSATRMRQSETDEREAEDDRRDATRVRREWDGGCYSDCDEPFDATSPTTNAEPAKVAVQRFADRLDIAGMRDLISSDWSCTPANVDAVISVPFRAFVLGVKREVKSAPKVSRGRAMLPTHAFVQSIIKAVEGKSHMYGGDLMIAPAESADVGGGREGCAIWVDDFHPTKNPKGCPPWVLVAVVTASCIDGLRHVVANVAELRTHIEEIANGGVGDDGNSNTTTNSFDIAAVVAEKHSDSAVAAHKRSKPPKIFSIGGLDICFPQTFLSAVIRFVREKSSSEGGKSRVWSDLSVSEKDEMLTAWFLTWFKGFAMFGRFARKCAGIPTWLAAYVCEIGDMFDSVGSNVAAIKKFLRDPPKMSDWPRKCEEPKSLRVDGPDENSSTVAAATTTVDDDHHHHHQTKTQTDDSVRIVKSEQKMRDVPDDKKTKNTKKKRKEKKKEKAKENDSGDRHRHHHHDKHHIRKSDDKVAADERRTGRHKRASKESREPKKKGEALTKNRKRKRCDDGVLCPPSAKRIKLTPKEQLPKNLSSERPISSAIADAHSDCDPSSEPLLPLLSPPPPPPNPYSKPEFLAAFICWIRDGAVASGLHEALFDRGVTLEIVRTIATDPPLLETIDDASIVERLSELAARPESDDTIVKLKEDKDDENPAVHRDL